jgi:glycosyltransferase involved in cell wall biosynthesis
MSNTDRPRVLFIHHGGARGGSPLSLLQLLRVLRKTIDVIVCSAMSDDDVIQLFSNEGFETCKCHLKMFDHTTLGSYQLHSPVGWINLLNWFSDYRRSSRELNNLILQIKPDIVHLNSLTLSPYAVIPERIGVPCVVHVREPILNGFFGLRKYWLQWHLKRYATEIISICEDNMNRLEIKNKGVVIYNPVDFKQFDWRIEQSQARRELNLPLDKSIVCFVGGSHEVKGPDLFLKAASIIIENTSNVHFLMPSFARLTRPKRTRSRRLICSMLCISEYLFINRTNTLYDNLKEKGVVTTTEFSYDIEKYIAASDVICVAHSKPHFARVIMESGAMKKPVVCFDVGGVSEVVINGKTGLLAPPMNTTMLADALIRLLVDPDYACKLGGFGFEQALQKFESTCSADAVLRVYERICGRPLIN